MSVAGAGAMIDAPVGVVVVIWAKPRTELTAIVVRGLMTLTDPFELAGGVVGVECGRSDERLAVLPDDLRASVKWVFLLWH